MGKSERLNDMMQYLSDKPSFNLKDIMDRFHISRSTAIRDVQSLEQIGMPIYSKPGRNGHYGILPNRLLSPILFTVDEVYSLYFSMQTLKAYQSTPFHLSADRLKRKFESCLSENSVEKLKRMEAVFHLAAVAHENESPFLRDVLNAAVEERVCRLTYKRESSPICRTVQFFHITSAHGQWYATGFDFETGHPKVFRCDKILALEESSDFQAKPLSSFREPQAAMFKAENATDFTVEISKKGVDRFHKEHYPSMKLHQEAGRFMIRGFYNAGEEDFVANYLISYGKELLSVQPEPLKLLILNRLDEYRQHCFTL